MDQPIKEPFKPTRSIEEDGWTRVGEYEVAEEPISFPGTNVAHD